MKKLTNKNSASSSKGASLTALRDVPFKFSISEQLDNKFAFKDLKAADIKALHNFIDITIGKKLTITQVDKLYLRTKGGVTQTINNKDVVHYGKDCNSFRVFGYYNSENYFNITRIDPKHKTNAE
ncbi:hypothetical protein FXF62_02035 [Streptococcus cristatus]|uniref:Uncharacterized protein n=1 Tax=Streptococcus cristatus TaxID=45634 RepID=A0A5B0DNA8_STRCR|nr:hypothetical protein [Streptococcus cristatus]KAA0967472.1 hypothetical protein FXF62_02035 [Streptococcus cristatus]